LGARLRAIGELGTGRKKGSIATKEGIFSPGVKGLVNNRRVPILLRGTEKEVLGFFGKAKSGNPKGGEMEGGTKLTLNLLPLPPPLSKEPPYRSSKPRYAIGESGPDLPCRARCDGLLRERGPRFRKKRCLKGACEGVRCGIWGHVGCARVLVYFGWIQEKGIPRQAVKGLRRRVPGII